MRLISLTLSFVLFVLGVVLITSSQGVITGYAVNVSPLTTTSSSMLGTVMILASIFLVFYSNNKK